MTAKNVSLESLKRIAETEYFLLPLLKNALKKYVINHEVKEMVGGVDNYFQYWKEHLGEPFYRMGNFILIGSVMEKSFREYYMEKRKYSNAIIPESNEAKDSGMRGVFQDVKRLTKLYQKYLNINLSQFKTYHDYQKYLLCRHLYVHNNGMLDPLYLKNWKELTGEDLQSELDKAKDDLYWFRPLNDFPQYLDAARGMIEELP